MQKYNYNAELQKNVIKTNQMEYNLGYRNSFMISLRTFLYSLLFLFISLLYLCQMWLIPVF